MKKMGIKDILHEVLHNEHRIVLLLEDSTIDEGEWVSVSEIAQHKGYYTTVGESVLPQGVFQTRSIQHRILG